LLWLAAGALYPQGGNMRRYETIFIIDPDLSDEDRTPLFERLTLLFPQLDGFLVEIDEWKTRKLAYEIKKKNRGYYVRLDYCGTGILVNEIERFFRIDDRVLKYLTVVIDKDVDLERLKAEIAEVESQKDQPDQEKIAEVEPKKDQPDQEEESETEQPTADVVESDVTENEEISAESNQEE
jgi:small subunit ribosomal protein S6